MKNKILKTAILIFATLNLTSCFIGPRDASSDIQTDAEYKASFLNQVTVKQGVEAPFLPDDILISRDLLFQSNPEQDIFGAEYFRVSSALELETILDQANLRGIDRLRIYLNNDITLERDLKIRVARLSVRDYKINFNGFKMIFDVPVKAKQRCALNVNGQDYSNYQDFSQYIKFEDIIMQDTDFVTASGAVSFIIRTTKLVGSFGLDLQGTASALLLQKTRQQKLDPKILGAGSAGVIVFHASNSSWNSNTSALDELILTFSSTNFINNEIPNTPYITHACFDYDSMMNYNYQAARNHGVTASENKQNCFGYEFIYQVKTQCKVDHKL